ncbi:hypothetical protein BS17DRAFT_476432 [Gyrodon lividus]|nr:hypothetical protein BS17DRAFT_476432 [Gyrodon lividus]
MWSGTCWLCDLKRRLRHRLWVTLRRSSTWPITLCLNTNPLDDIIHTIVLHFPPPMEQDNTSPPAPSSPCITSEHGATSDVAYFTAPSPSHDIRVWEDTTPRNANTETANPRERNRAPGCEDTIPGCPGAETAIPRKRERPLVDEGADPATGDHLDERSSSSIGQLPPPSTPPLESPMSNEPKEDCVIFQQSAASAVDRRLVITRMKATDLCVGLRRIPAGFYVRVLFGNEEYRTTNKPANLDRGMTEWLDHICLWVYTYFS